MKTLVATAVCAVLSAATGFSAVAAAQEVESPTASPFTVPDEPDSAATPEAAPESGIEASSDAVAEESVDASSDATSPTISVPTPSGLRAARYSGFAGGIAWNGGFIGTSYEVSRDGVVVFEGNTSSYVDNEIVVDTTPVYAVVAIDGTTGERSEAATITMPLRGSNGDELPDEQDGDFASVTGLIAVRYGVISGEIAWDRLPTGGETDTAGARYQVTRDGEVVVSASSATSYVDFSLEPGISYNYEVVAIAADGRRSEPRSITMLGTAGSSGPDEPDTPNTPDGPDTDPTVALDAQFGSVIKALAGYQVDAEESTVLFAAANATESALNSVPNEEGTGSRYDCELGGTFEVIETTVDDSIDDVEDITNTAIYTFDACQYNTVDWQVDGTFERVQNTQAGARASRDTLTRTWDSFSYITGGDDDVQISGSTSTSTGVDVRPGLDERIVELASFYKVQREAESYVREMTDVSFSLTNRTGGGLNTNLQVSGTFMQSGDTPAVEGTVTVGTVAPVVTEESAGTFTGELEFSTDLGERLSVIAREGEPGELAGDLNYMAADGTMRTTEDAAFPELSIVAPFDQKQEEQ